MPVILLWDRSSVSGNANELNALSAMYTTPKSLNVLQMGHHEAGATITAHAQHAHLREVLLTGGI